MVWEYTQSDPNSHHYTIIGTVKMHTISFSHTIILPILIPHQKAESCTHHHTFFVKLFVEEVRYENELRALSENQGVTYHLDLPHLSDTFVGFSTTPRHIAFAGEDTTGRTYP